MISKISDRRGPSASMQELVNWRAFLPSSCLLVLSGLILVVSNGILNAHAAAHNNQSVTSSRPYWHKPGCHQVGHTRTISIPGCVKFNLSTNACRGFCMSFSIPATEDIGPPPPPPATQLEHLNGGVTGGVTGDAGSVSGPHAPTTMSPMIEVAGTMDTQQLASIISGQVDGQPLIITRRMAREREEDKARNAAAASSAQAILKTTGGKQQQQSGGTGGLQMSEFLHLAGQTKSPLAGAVGDLSDRRDVISVGQCCNMMETEDVTINLRCGLNETRKLVFKSAKTCECFFCKHL